MRWFSLFFRDAGNGGSSTPPATPPATPASAEDIAAAVLKEVGDRTARAETGVLKSMADQYGMSEADLKALLDKHKADAAAKLTPEAQQRVDAAMEKANARLIAAEVKTLGAAMGLVDTAAALKLWDASGVKVADDGAVSGAKEALEALKKTSPYLFGQSVPPTTPPTGGFNPPPGNTPPAAPASLQDAVGAYYQKG